MGTAALMTVFTHECLHAQGTGVHEIEALALSSAKSVCYEYILQPWPALLVHTAFQSNKCGVPDAKLTFVHQSCAI